MEPGIGKTLTENKAVAGLLAVLVTMAVGMLLIEMKAVMLPFIIAMYLSYLFKPIISFLKKRRIPVFVGLIVVLVLVSGIIFGLSMILYSSIDAFVAALPRYQFKLERILNSVVLEIYGIAAQFDVNLNEVDWRDAIQLSSLTDIATSSAGGFLNFFTNAILILLFMMFILAGTGDMTAKIEVAFKDHQSDKMASIIGSIDDKVRQYLFTKTLLSLLTGTISTIILLIMGVDFALLWGFLIFLLNFIPNIGSIFATILPVLISLLQFDSIGPAILVAILLVLTQFIMGNVVEPRMMAFSLNLSPLLVLVSLGIWAWIWGIWGMILSVPIMATLKIIMEHIEPLAPLAHVMGGTIKKKPAKAKA
jgi:AI-2 transport protein TqsA